MAPHPKERIAAALLPVLAGTLGIATDAFAKSETTILGRIGMGLEKIDEYENQDLFEVRVGVKTKRRKGVRAYVEVTADENDRETRIHEAFADYKSPDEGFRARAGRGKRVLGWEYAMSANENLGIDKSLTYRYLEQRALVGRDYLASATFYPGMRVEEEDGEDSSAEKTEEKNGAPSSPETTSDAPKHAPLGEVSGIDSSSGNPVNLIDDARPWRLGISGHYDESNDFAGIASAIFTPGARTQYGAWFSYAQNGATRTQIQTFQSVLSAMYEAHGVRADVELFYGSDPYRSLMEHDYGGGRKVYFGSMKAEIGFFLGKWSPYFTWTHLFPDLKHTGDRGEEEILGLKVFATARLTFAAEYSRIRNSSAYNPTEETVTNDRGAILGRYFF